MTPLDSRRDPVAGLCGACRHVKINRSDRGSVFYFCQRSLADPRFRKYPALPVLACPGYEPAEAIAGPEDPSVESI